MKRTRILALSTASLALPLSLLLGPGLASALTAEADDGGASTDTQTDTQTDTEPYTPTQGLALPTRPDDYKTYSTCLEKAGESADARSACAGTVDLPLWMQAMAQSAYAPYTLDPAIDVTCVRAVATSPDTITLEPVEYDDMLADPDSYRDYDNISCDLAQADGSAYPWAEVIASDRFVNSVRGFRPGLMQFQAFERSR